MTEERPDFQIVSVTLDQIFLLRRSVLQPGNADYHGVDGDTDPETRHFGVVLPDTNELICVATFMPRTYQLRPEIPAVQLREMATAKEWQGRGAGGFLLQFAIGHFRQEGFDLIWANGRDSAIAFYERNGMSLDGQTGVSKHGTAYSVVARSLV